MVLASKWLAYKNSDLLNFSWGSLATPAFEFKKGYVMKIAKTTIKFLALTGFIFATLITFSELSVRLINLNSFLTNLRPFWFFGLPSGLIFLSLHYIDLPLTSKQKIFTLLLTMLVTFLFVFFSFGFIINYFVGLISYLPLLVIFVYVLVKINNKETKLIQILSALVIIYSAIALLLFALNGLFLASYSLIPLFILVLFSSLSLIKQFYSLSFNPLIILAFWSSVASLLISIVMGAMGIGLLYIPIVFLIILLFLFIQFTTNSYRSISTTSS